MYVIAFYEMDREYGGPEEGGWWYDSGQLVRAARFRPTRNEDEAYEYCRRVNNLLNRLQRNKRSTGSVIYSGGRYAACVFEDVAPRYFPEERPYYE